MDFFELIRARKSCRKYDHARPVEPEKLAQCLEAARIAPSACNSQPWHYYAVTTPDTVAQFAKCLQDAGMNKWSDSCTAFVAITEENAGLASKVGGHIKDQQYAQTDIGISAAQFVLAATDLGLATCIIGWYNENKLRALLGIAPDVRIRLVISMGYALEPQEHRIIRKDTDKIVTIL